MKKVMYYCLLLFLITSYTAKTPSIEWQETYRLSWKDFKGKPDHSSDVAAITASGITYDLTAVVRSNKVEVDCKVSAHFYPEKSWYKKALVDSIVLAHEQLHFDITELYARKLKNIVNTTVFTENVKQQMKSLYDKINQDLDDFQDRYDMETDYSRDYEKQEEWGIKIAKALQETR